MIMKLNFKFLIMKTFNFFISALTIIFFFGCGSKMNYTSLNESKELKMPFNKKDYVDTESIFYSIQSTRGTGAKSGIAKMNTLKAKSDLTLKINSLMNSKVTNQGRGSDNSSFNNQFTSISESEVKSYVEQLKLVDEKWYVVGNNSSGKEEFELWQVYSVTVNNVSNIAMFNN